MTLRKNILPNLFLHALLLMTSLYMLIQAIAQPGNVQLLFIVSLCTVGWYGARHVPFPSLFHWFVLCYVTLFYFYPVILPALDISFKAADHVVAGYCFMTVGGIHLFILFYELTRSTKGLKDPTPEEAFVIRLSRLRIAVLGLLGASVAGALLIILDVGSLSVGTLMDMANTSRADRKLESGALSLLGSYLVIFGGLGFVLIPVYAREKFIQAVLITCVFILVDAFLMLAFRVRTPIVLHLIGISVGFLYVRHRVVFAEKPKVKKKKRPRVINSRQTLVRMAFFILIVGILGIYMRMVRGFIGHANDLSVLRQDLSQAVEFALAVDDAVGGDFGYTPTVFKVIEFVPNEHDYLRGQSYYRLFFIGIPRFIWDDKPLNTGIIVGRWLYPGTIVQSNPPGVMGDLYVNFGYLGILGFIIYGCLFAVFDNKKSLAYYIMVATSFGSIFHFARGSFTNIILQLLVLYIVSVLIQRFILVRE